MDTKHFLINIVKVSWPIVFLILGWKIIEILPIMNGYIKPGITLTSFQGCNYGCVELYALIFTAIGTVGATVVALWVAVKASLYLKKEKLSGVSLIDPDLNGVIKLINNSKIDTNIKILRFLLTEGNNKKITEKLLRMSVDKLKEQVLSVDDWDEIKSLNLSSGESSEFHLYNLDARSTYTCFVALKLQIEDMKSKYYVLTFSGKKAEEELRNLTFPHNKWITYHSFSQ